MLRTVLDLVTNVAIVGTQVGTGFTVINAGAEALFGYSTTEFIEDDIVSKLFDPGDVQQRAALLSARVGRTVQGEDVFTDPSVLGISQEWQCQRKDGHRFMVALVVRSMLADDGSITGYVVAAHDVTEQKQYVASLRESTTRAEAANQAKSEFLANMSHEIRTPINTVIGLTYLLGRSNLDPDQRKMLGTVAIASQSLLSVINDVLDLSKIEAGEMLIEHVPFAPVALLEEVASVVMTTAAAKGIALTLDFAPDLPPVLRGDVVHLRQILTNLLANAIKFTYRGCVTLHMRQRAATAASTTLEIAVADTGIGMSAATRQRLFTPFSQADSSITRRFGGTGLGLSIVKHLVTLMGGEVSVESTEGVGSAFTVRLHFALATPDALTSEFEQPTTADESGLDGMRILIVDDSPINLEVARRILNLEGAHVELASNGLEAFDRLGAGPQDFDIVLMDVQMSVLNGYDATRRIRQDLGLSALPIIALTANALSSERDRAINSGMNDFNLKPFIVGDLVRSIRRLVTVARPIAQTSHFRTSDLDGSQTKLGSAWPVIAGIEAEDVHGRLGGDVGLFKRLLGMFLAEFADLSHLRTGNADELTQTAARLHKLKGSAGLLGATAIHVMAGEGESAGLAGDGTGTAAIVGRIGVLIDALAVCAEPVLVVVPLPETAHHAATAPLDLTLLIDLLERQSLLAGGEFMAVTPHLRGRMAVAEFNQLQGDIDNLRFAAAVSHLRSFTAIELPPV